MLSRIWTMVELCVPGAGMSRDREASGAQIPLQPRGGGSGVGHVQAHRGTRPRARAVQGMDRALARRVQNQFWVQGLV